MATVNKLHKLAELAKERSSECRRALLREVTDLFFDAPPETGSPVQAQFDAVLSQLASEAAQDAREEMSRRFADTPVAPPGMIRKLARDAIEVAAPILQKSGVLSEEDLLAIVHETSQQHLRAISARTSVPERISHAIVERGDDETVATLVKNEGAQLSRQTFEVVSERAQTSETLQAPLAHRVDTPTDLLADLTHVVEGALREHIQRRFDKLDPGVLEAALAASHTRLEARLKEDKAITEAQRFITSKQVRKELNGALLVRLLREKEYTKFCIGFAELAGVDYSAAKKALEEPTIDALALICKASTAIDRALFVTLAVLRSDAPGDAFSHARELGKVYDDLSKEQAERVMRFYKMRKNAAAAAA